MLLWAAPLLLIAVWPTTAAAGPGQSPGEIALLRDIERTATVTATAALVMRSIERARFLGAVTGHRDASNHAEAVVTRVLDIR